MSLFDFFFPEQAQASHLRDIAESQRLEGRRKQFQRHRESRDLHLELKACHDRITDLRDEVGQAALVIEALIEVVESAGVASREELLAVAQNVDARDGVIDGRITKAARDREPFVAKRKIPKLRSDD